MVYKSLDKKTASGAVKNETMQNKELAEELPKPIIRKFEKQKVHSSFIDNLTKGFVNKGIRFLLCVIDIYTKYAWVISLKDKKAIATNAFQKILDEAGRKPNKTWVDTGSKFYNRSIKSWLEKNSIEMYLTHNEGKSVVAKRFIRTLKNKIYKYMTSISKNMYIHKLDNMVNEYNDTYHSTIKMKSFDLNSSTYIDFDKKNKKEDAKPKAGDHVRISKYKNSFCKRLCSTFI